MDVNPKTKAAQAEATRGALIQAARQLFTERGFAETATEEIVRQAGVTRGALYHHYRDKADLFREVAEQVQAEVVQKIHAAAAVESNPWGFLVKGAEAFLDACLDPAVQQICLRDGPSALGWQTWREIVERHPLAVTGAAVRAAMAAGEIDEQPVEPLTHMLLGALIEAARYIARSADPAAAREEVGSSVARLLEAMRRR